MSDGGIKANKVPANQTTIYEVNENYRVEWYKKSKKWFGFEDEVKYWKIYIPKGSVTDDFTVDLE
jgi:hypothetical protein